MTVQMPGFKTALRASLAVVLLMTMLLANAAPAGAAFSPVSNAIAPAGTASNALDSAGANGGEKLLKFTSAGHVLGFSHDSVIIAARDHMVKTEFIGSRTVTPEADAEALAENNADIASPLSRVTYHNVWDDVTVVYEASPGAIVKSTYYVNATEDGVPVERIRLGYNRPLTVDEQGNLVIAYESGIIVESAPVAWQDIDERRKPVTATFTLYGQREVGFTLGDYVPGIPVVIDPDLTWNTFLGGNGWDEGTAIAVDGSGNVYVAGRSDATWGSPVLAYTAGNDDAFAAKLDSSGNLTWNTFLGGNGWDEGTAIAVDGSGNVYVAGMSDATWGSPVLAYTAGPDAFAAKLNSSGNLTWNTFLGGDGWDYGSRIALDGSGNVYVAGISNATWGSPVLAYTADSDAFAAKLDSSGNLTWNSFLGGSGYDEGTAIAVDGSGNVYVAGRSDATWGAPVLAYAAGPDAFVIRLNASGWFHWNTFLGGNGSDYGSAIAVDGSGNVYVGGRSDATWGSPVLAYTADRDAFAAKLNSSGNLTWNTFLGGSGPDYGFAIAVDGSSNVYVGGRSDATWGSPVLAYTASWDAFAARLDSSGNLTWNTFLGGDGWDRGSGIAVDGSGNVYVAGTSDATWGSPVLAYTASPDAFAAKLGITPPTVTTTAATDITTTTATLNMDYDFKDYSSGTVQFAYKKTADSSWTYTIWQAKSALGGYAEPLTGLTSNTKYQFKARLKYDSTEIEGSVLTFTTPGQPPAPEVDTAVGGESYPVNKLGILAHWIGLAMLLIGGMTCFALRRRRART